MTTSQSETTVPPGAGVVETLKPRWGWIVVSGLVTLVFGVLALSMPLGAIFAMTILFGAYALADGVLSIIAAVRLRRTGAEAEAGDHFWPLVLRGALGLFAGFLVLALPGFAAVSLTAFAWAMLAIWAITTGIFEIAAAIRLRREIRGEWLLGLSGLISLAVGVAIPVILFANPAAGIVTMGWLIGFYALLHGIAEIGLGLVLRKLGKE